MVYIVVMTTFTSCMLTISNMNLASRVVVVVTVKQTEAAIFLLSPSVTATMVLGLK